MWKCDWGHKLAKLNTNCTFSVAIKIALEFNQPSRTVVVVIVDVDRRCHIEFGIGMGIASKRNTNFSLIVT